MDFSFDSFDIRHVVMAIYFGILFLIGIVASRKIKGVEDFYVGGKKLGYWVVAFSARATGESGWLLLGLTGMGAMAGYSAYWVVVGELLGVAVSWFFMAKRFKRLTDKYDSITIPDYLESRFKATTSLLRIIAATALSVFVVIYVSAQIDITGKAFEQFLEIDYYHGAILGFLIVVAYIFTGGFVAVVWSDFFQGIMMLLGLVVLPIVGFYYMQGDLHTGLAAIDPALVSIWGGDANPWINVAAMLGFAMIGLGFLGSPQIYVRFISVKSEAEIDRGKWVAILFTLLTDVSAVTIGILGRYLFTSAGQDAEAVLGANGEEVLIVMLEHFMPLTILAIYIAVVLSAIMSTIDSLLVVASSAVTRDFYQKIMKPNVSDKNMAMISRAVTVGMALMALGISMTVAWLIPGRTVFWFVIFGWSGIAATFCPVIILSLFWKGYSEQGAIASMVTGFLCVPFFKFVIQPIEGIGIYFEKLDVLAPSFALAMLAGYAFSKVYPPKNVPDISTAEKS